MDIQVDWYKKSGKWAYGGVVDIGDATLSAGSVQQALIDNQKILIDGWQGQYTVVINSLPEHNSDPEYAGFFNGLFSGDQFLHLTKSVPLAPKA